MLDGFTGQTRADAHQVLLQNPWEQYDVDEDFYHCMTSDQWKVFTLLPKDGKEISVREVAENFFNKTNVDNDEYETIKNILEQIYFTEIDTELIPIASLVGVYGVLQANLLYAWLLETFCAVWQKVLTATNPHLQLILTNARCIVWYEGFSLQRSSGAADEI